MIDWLDSFTKVHRLPGTFRAAMRYARRREPRPLPSTEGNRIQKPKLTWRETKEFLSASSERHAPPKDVPIEFLDSTAQAAFEAVYRNRLHMLRVQTGRAAPAHQAARSSGEG